MAEARLLAAQEPQGRCGKRIARLALLRSSSPGQGLQYELRRLQVALPSLNFKGDEAQAHFIKDCVAPLLSSIFVLHAWPSSCRSSSSAAVTKRPHFHVEVLRPHISHNARSAEFHVFSQMDLGTGLEKHSWSSLLPRSCFSSFLHPQ